MSVSRSKFLYLVPVEWTIGCLTPWILHEISMCHTELGETSSHRENVCVWRTKYLFGFIIPWSMATLIFQNTHVVSVCCPDESNTLSFLPNWTISKQIFQSRHHSLHPHSEFWTRTESILIMKCTLTPEGIQGCEAQNWALSSTQ